MPWLAKDIHTPAGDHVKTRLCGMLCRDLWFIACLMHGGGMPCHAMIVIVVALCLSGEWNAVPWIYLCSAACPLDHRVVFIKRDVGENSDTLELFEGLGKCFPKFTQG
jgi:hypothetical protein